MKIKSCRACGSKNLIPVVSLGKQYFKLDNKLIKFAVERNPEKWGKIISSVGISIISEEQARKDKPDYMLVLPWFFKKEFLQREKHYLEKGGHFIFPLPKFEVI